MIGIHYVLCVTILTGLGTALAYTPGYIIIGEYFEKRKAFAMSMATFASGIGAMFPPVMLYLFHTYGFPGAMLIIGGICLNCCIGGALYRPIHQNYNSRKSKEVEIPLKESQSNGINGKNENSKQEKVPSRLSLHSEKLDEMPLTIESQLESTDLESQSHKREVKFSDGAEVMEGNTEHVYKEKINTEHARKQFKKRSESVFHESIKKQKVIECSLFRKARFITLSSVIFCNAFNLGLTSAFIPILAIERGISEANAVSLLTVSGVGSTIGTLLFGYILDLQCIKSWRCIFYAVCLIIVGLTTVFNPLAQTFVAFALFQFSRAVFAGIIMSQRATIVSDIVGRKRLNSAIGLVLFFTSLGFLVGRAIGGESYFAGNSISRFTGLHISESDSYILLTCSCIGQFTPGADMTPVAN